MTLRRWSIALTVAAVVGLAVATAVRPHRASTMSLDVTLDPQSPGLFRIAAGGRVIDDVSTGRNTTGAPYFAGGFGDGLEFNIVWLDVAANAAWEADLSLQSRALSAFDPDRDVLALRIHIGPGAEVRAETPPPAALRLIHDGRAADMPADLEQAAPIVVEQVCARPLAMDDPRVARLAAAAADPGNSVHGAIQRHLAARDRAARPENGPPSRCAEGAPS
jgi:hypothetical protein